MRLPTRLLQRKLKAQKGDFGHIFILAGCARFLGAAFLCAEAALRSGAGLVTLGIPQSLITAAIKRKPREVMLLPLAETKEITLSLRGYQRIREFSQKADVLALGCGLSQNPETQKLVRKIIVTTDKPMVIDADGLNALAGHLGILRTTPACRQGREYRRVRSEAKPPRRGRNTILTPHPGEMAGLLGVRVEKIQANRRDITRKFASRYQTTVVLKGHNTVVADSRNYYINQTGNPGMSTAGSGDVLTGMIAAFLGQGLSCFLAAKYAVYLHGLAGDLAAKEKTQISLIASDIIAKIPQAIKRSS